MLDKLYSWAVMIPSLAAFLAVYLAFLGLSRREESLEAKLKRFTAWRAPGSPSTEKKNTRSLLSELGRLTPRRWSEKLDRELAQGGIPVRGGEFLVVIGLLMALFFLIGLILFRQPLGAVLLASLGLLGPYFWLKGKQNRKHRQFDNQLADALLIMANSLKSGFSLLQAMEMVSQEMPNPIAEEFRVTLREMTYGTATETALSHLAKRVGSADLDLVVTAIMIQRQIGGNLSEVLLNIHATIQDRLRIKQEIRTLTASGRTSGYIIAALPFGIAAVLTVLNPSYLKLLVTEPLGWAMLAGGLVMQFIGFLLIRKIVNIEV